MSDYPKIQFSKFIKENQLVIRTETEKEFTDLTGLTVKGLLKNVITPTPKPTITPKSTVSGFEEGEPCNKCGAEMVKNPKTGKIFCSDKCWLAKEI